MALAKRLSTTIKEIPKASLTTMPSAAPAVASGFTEAYVAIISLIATKCARIDPNETDLVAACTKFKLGVVNLKTYVSSLDDILPVQQDLTPLPSLATLATTSDLQWPEEIQRGYQLLKGGDTWGDISFTDDKRDQSLFSPLNKANIDNILAKKQPTPGPIIQLISLGFNILSQTRETRLQMDANLYVLKWTLASCLLPQLTLLLLLCLQWVITRRKQGKLKKQIRKAEENHQMVARIRGQIPWREQSRFVEV